MQGSLFSESTVKNTPPPVKKTRKAKATKATKVSRSIKLKRHPSRAPIVKRVVKTKQVVMVSNPDGPRGNIIERDGDDLLVQWPGMTRLYRHNASFMRPVEDK